MKLETLLRRAFQDPPLARYAERDPFLEGLKDKQWYKDLRTDMGLDVTLTELATFTALSGHEKTLTDASITTLKELRARLEDHNGLRALATDLNLPVEQLASWQALLDMWALGPHDDDPAIPIRWVDILAAIDVTSVDSLSSQDAHVLADRLDLARRALGVDEKPPDVAEVRTWIRRAGAVQPQPARRGRAAPAAQADPAHD